MWFNVLAQAIARTLASERRANRSNSGRAWEAYAMVMDKEGNPQEAHRARKAAYELGIGQGQRRIDSEGSNWFSRLPGFT